MRVGIDILFSSDFPIGSVSVSCSLGSSSAEEVTDLKRWIAKQICKLCADICDWCTKQCDAHDMEHCNSRSLEGDDEHP